MACTDCDDGALGLRAVGDVNECSRESVAVYHVPRTAKKLRVIKSLLGPP